MDTSGAIPFPGGADARARYVLIRQAFRTALVKTRMALATGVGLACCPGCRVRISASVGNCSGRGVLCNAMQRCAGCGWPELV